MAKGCSRRKSRGGGRSIEELVAALSKLENPRFKAAAETAIQTAKADPTQLEAAEAAVKTVEDDTVTTIKTIPNVIPASTEEPSIATEEAATEGGRRRRSKKSRKARKSKKSKKSRKSKKSQKKN